jgi:hypothetical protein
MSDFAQMRRDRDTLRAELDQAKTACAILQRVVNESREQVPDGYRLQPLSEYDAMISAPLDADNAQLKAVWKWCRQTATDYGNGNARQRAAATAYLAAAHHIKSKYFRGCSDRSMIAASQKEEGKP